MKGLNVKLEADNLAEAHIVTSGPNSVHVKIEPTDRWDAEGLMRLSALLKGVAATLVATTALLLMCGVGDADSWWTPGPTPAHAVEEVNF